MAIKTTKLFNKNFFLLWQGQFISRIGSQVYFIAMIIWIKEATDSASLLGIMGFIAGIPAVIFSIIGGTYADRHSRKKIIVYSDFISGVIMIILALLFYFLIDSMPLIIGFLLFTTVATSIISSYFTPAISASIPDIVPKSKLTSANSWSQASQQSVAIFGLALGGVLYALLGAPLLILLNGLTFIFSSLSEMFIDIPQTIPQKKESWKEKIKDFKNDIVEGFQYVWARAGLKKLVLTSVLINFFAVPIALLLPFYVDIVLHLEEVWLGYLLSISAVGGLIGYLVAGIYKFTPKKRALILLLFIFLDGVFYILLGVFATIIPVIVILFFSGFVAGYVQVHIYTILQISTKSETRGRVFGFIGTISGALIPIGMGLAGFVADLTNKNIPLIYKTSGIIILIISFVIIQSKDIKEFLSINTNVEDEEEKLNTKINSDEIQIYDSDTL